MGQNNHESVSRLYCRVANMIMLCSCGACWKTKAANFYYDLCAWTLYIALHLHVSIGTFLRNVHSDVGGNLLARP